MVRTTFRVQFYKLIRLTDKIFPWNTRYEIQTPRTVNTTLVPFLETVSAYSHFPYFSFTGAREGADGRSFFRICRRFRSNIFFFLFFFFAMTLRTFRSCQVVGGTREIRRHRRVSGFFSSESGKGGGCGGGGWKREIGDAYTRKIYVARRSKGLAATLSSSSWRICLRGEAAVREREETTPLSHHDSTR